MELEETTNMVGHNLKKSVMAVRGAMYYQAMLRAHYWQGVDLVADVDESYFACIAARAGRNRAPNQRGKHAVKGFNG